MTTREARFGLLAFGLLLAALAANLLALQTSRHEPQRRGERIGSSAAERAKLAPPLPAAAPARTDADAQTRTAIASPAVEGETAETIRAVQRELQLRNYETGAADGVPGLMTRAAIIAFEFDHGMPLTGEATEDTLKRILLGGPAGGTASRGDRKTAAEGVIRTVQQTLSGLGYNTGKADGRLGEDTQRAIRDFEIDSKMPETGRISGTLIARLAKAAGNGRMPAVR